MIADIPQSPDLRHFYVEIGKMQRVEAKKLPNLVLKADLGSPSSKQGANALVSETP